MRTHKRRAPRYGNHGLFSGAACCSDCGSKLYFHTRAIYNKARTKVRYAGAYNMFDMNISLPQTCKNLSNLPTAKVTLDLSGLVSRKIAVTNFSVKNLASDKTAEIYTKALAVTVVGPEDKISKLTENNLVGEISLSERENFTGHTEMPVMLSHQQRAELVGVGTYIG